MKFAKSMYMNYVIFFLPHEQDCIKKEQQGVAYMVLDAVDIGASMVEVINMGEKKNKNLIICKYCNYSCIQDNQYTDHVGLLSCDDKKLPETLFLNSNQSSLF